MGSAKRYGTADGSWGKAAHIQQCIHGILGITQRNNEGDRNTDVRIDHGSATNCLDDMY